MSALPDDARALLWSCDPIGLADLQEAAELRTRVDRKYVVDWPTAVAVLRRLAPTHRALEIDGRRSFRYDTVYFDSEDLGAYRAHMQQRRRRYKARTRQYVDSGLEVFEVKLKGPRGETVKHQLPYDPADHGTVTEQARAFLLERLEEAYPQIGLPALAPTVRTDYERLTFAHGHERLTCDFDLRFTDGGDRAPGLDGGHVILESKCASGLGLADRELRRHHVRPVACSKYCVGVGLLRPDAKTHDLRWLLGRYFRPEGAVA